MNTEIVRHIVTGGALDDDGGLKASETVIQEAQKHSSLKSFLVMETSETHIGKATLLDYVKVNGKKHVKVSKPNAEHVALGVPNEDMKT